MTLLEFLRLMRKHLVVLFIGAALGLALGIVFAVYRSSPQESVTATSMLYVSSSASDSSAEDGSTDAKRSLQAGQMLAYDVGQLAMSDRVKDSVAANLGLDNLSDYTVSASSIGGVSRLVSIQVTGAGAQEVTDVANAMAEETAKISKDVLEVSSATELNVDTVYRAEPQEVQQTEPELRKYGIAGLFGGLFLAICVVAAKNLFDTRIASSQELENLTGLPVVCSLERIEG